jgi:hypothetical protein
MSKKFELTMIKERETARMVRFQEVPSPYHAKVIGTLYVSKAAVGNQQEIKVIVEVND